MQPEANARTQELETAFNVFSQLSEQLAASYRLLENRVVELNGELAAARSERYLQFAEKERLANRLQHLLAVLPGGVIVLDGTGCIQEFNPAALDLLGEPLLAMRWPEVAARAFVPHTEHSREFHLRDGRTVNIRASALGAEPGKILLLQDVTQTRLLQERLSRHQRLSAMGEMAASLAHQIRTPLASAILYASHLERPALVEDERRRFADKILSRMRHLERLVSDMLLFARGGDIGNERVVIKDLLYELQHTLEPQLTAYGSELQVDNELQDAELRGNREALLSALQNLAVNAMQACGRGGQLRLAARACGDGNLQFIELMLRDNGPGIPPELHEQIFKPFFTTRAQGTGLGLAVVQAIARAHNGSVWHESQPGAGSTFILRLPLNREEGALPSGVPFHSHGIPGIEEYA